MPGSNISPALCDCPLPLAPFLAEPSILLSMMVQLSGVQRTKIIRPREYGFRWMCDFTIGVKVTGTHVSWGSCTFTAKLAFVCWVVRHILEEGTGGLTLALLVLCFPDGHMFFLISKTVREAKVIKLKQQDVEIARHQVSLVLRCNFCFALIWILFCTYCISMCVYYEVHQQTRMCVCECMCTRVAAEIRRGSVSDPLELEF